LLAVAALAHGQATDAGAQSPATADETPQEPDAGQDAAAGQEPDAGLDAVAGEPPSAAAEPPAAAGEPPPPAEELQPEAEQLPEDTGEMVVTARRRKETIQSVPVAVTALSEKQLESSSIRDVSDLNGRAPGFTANQGGSQVTPGALSTAIRGIGIIEVEKSYELPVGTMIDGIILGNAVGSNVANFDLESIEILRGAQGTLFGRNVTAGLISLRTVRPNTQEYTGKAAFTLGSFNRRDYKLSVNAPVIENVLGARVALMWLNEDGYMNRIVNNVQTGKHSPRLNQLYAVGSLLFTPTKDLDVYIKYEHQRYRGQGLASIVASDARSSFLCSSHPGDPNYCRPQNAQGQNIDLNDLSNRQKLSDRSNARMDQEYDLNAITGEVTYRLSPKYSFVSLTGWRAFDDDSWTDIDATPDNQVNAHRFGPYKQITEELRFHAKPRYDLNLVAGLYGWYSRYRAISETRDLLETRLFDNTPRTAIDNPATPWDELTDGVNPPGSFNVADAQQTSYSAAAFAQGDWEFLTNTTLTLGGRLTHDIKDLKAVFYTDRPGVYMGESYPPLVVTFPADPNGLPFAADNPGDHALVDKDSWTRFTAKANLSYMFDEEMIGENNSLLVYGGYASGFRSGGFNGRPATVTVAKPYDPETVDQFELGLKSSWGRGVFVANLAGYYTLYHDKQESYQIPDPGTSQGYASAYGNAGEASIKGLELELSSMPLRGNVPVIDRFRFWGAAALTDARYDEFKVALSGTTVQDYAKGQYEIQMRLAPRVQVSAGLDLPFEFPGSVGRIVPSVSYRYRSEQRVELTTDPDGRPNRLGMSDPAGYLDTSLTAEFDNFLALQWRLTGYVRNITDYVELLGANNVGIGTRAVFGRPRTWGLEIQARYN
jgi:iron complex outermembrane receptor protein